MGSLCTATMWSFLPYMRGEQKLGVATFIRNDITFLELDLGNPPNNMAEDIGIQVHLKNS